MAYAQIHDETFAETEDEKEEPYNWPIQNKYLLLSYRNLCGVAVCLWITTTVVLGWVLSRGFESVENHAATLLPFPRVPSHVVMFDSDAKFHYTMDDTGESAWSSLMPNDGGILTIHNPRKYHLPASYKDRNNSHSEVYSISMYHQLHCLNSIRLRLGTLEGYIDRVEINDHHGKRMVFANESHVDHCFDYLRQAIMCAGDLSLEHSVEPDEFGFNGWGTAHQCADWQAMWDIAMERRYDTAQP